MATNNLKRILIKEGIKQSELSRVTNISITTINRIYNKKREGSATTNHRLLNGINSILKEEKYFIEDIF